VRTYRTKVEKSRQIFGIFRKIFFNLFPSREHSRTCSGCAEARNYPKENLFLNRTCSFSMTRLNRKPAGQQKKRTPAGIRFGRSRTKSAAKVKARRKAPELVRRGGTTTAP